MKYALYRVLLIFCLFQIPQYAVAQPVKSPNYFSVNEIHGGRLTSDQAGLQRVPLQSLPTEWQTNPSFIRVFLDTVEIPRLITSSDLVFFLPPTIRTWSSTYGVVLRFTPSQQGKIPLSQAVQSAVAPLSTYTASFKYEEQNIYISADPVGEHVDHWWGWYWLRFGTTQPAAINIQVPLDDQFMHIDQSAQLKLRFHGGSRGTEHRAAIQINGTNIGTVEWQGRVPYEPNLTIPAGILSTTNIVTIQPLTTSDSLENAYIDWLTFDYVRTLDTSIAVLEFDALVGSYSVQVPVNQEFFLWDVSDPYNPRLVHGWTQTGSEVRWQTNQVARYALATHSTLPVAVFEAWHQPDLTRLNLQADYIAITYNPPTSTSWSTALQPLLDHREQQGLSTLTVDVQWIYDQFGSGLIDPESIRRFLKYAYITWNPKPQYVLLVGDGTNDPRRYNGPLIQNQTFIPPYLSYVDPWIGETAADNRYVTFEGADDLPDLHLGRWPVQSSEQVSLLVSKTLTFEQTPFDAAWLNRIVFVADDAEPLGAGDFPALSEAARTYIPTTFISPTLYFTPETNLAQFRTSIVNEINQGALFVSYIGHAGIDIWGNESFYRSTEIQQLSNASALPIMLPMTCYAGYYHDPATVSLTEQELLRPTGGSVASWAPTGLGIATGHDHLQRGLFVAVFEHGMRRFGPATSYGKMLLAQNGIALDLLNTYTLFGDPALLIPLPFYPITANQDMYTIERDTSADLPVLLNDTNPYSSSLMIDSYTQPAFGQVSFENNILTYTPSQRFVGSDTFSYTAINPTNGSQSTAVVTLQVVSSKLDLFLPVMRR